VTYALTGVQTVHQAESETRPTGDPVVSD